MTTPTQGPGPLAIRHEAGTNLESNSSSISAMSTLVETGRGVFPASADMSGTAARGVANRCA